MRASRVMNGFLGAVAVLGLVMPALGGGADAAPRNLKVRLPASIPFGGGIGAFTPAAADPGRSAALSASGLAATGFRFTPAAAPGSRRAVTVAVRARTLRPDPNRTQLAGSAVAGLTPAAYNLGVSVGWRRFALSGDVARIDNGLLPLGREAVDLGLTYSGRQWSTRVQLGADRALGDRPALMGPEQSYSVDLGGSYALTRNLEVTGGVRYKLQRDRVDALLDDRRDSQAIYLGTAFRF